MNRFILPLLVTALLAACADEPQQAASAGNGDALTADATADMRDVPMPQATVASAKGTVESVDPAGGRIVIAHGPVDALGWPAMTMGFSATPEQARAVSPGQEVSFDFNSQGPNNTITRIEPVQ